MASKERGHGGRGARGPHERDRRARGERRGRDDRHGQAERPIRILLVDDHVMFAQSLQRMLASEPDLDVVTTVGTVAEACVEAARRSPDVVLLDFALPDGTGADAAARIRAARPEVRLVMVTAISDALSVAAALEAGCDGYITKDQAADTLVEAVRAVVRGRTVLPAELLASAVPFIGRPAAVTLTPREAEVLQCVAEGQSSDEIATRLGVSVHTVRNHVQRAIAKLEVHSRTEAVAAAVRRGIIPGPARP